MRLAIARLVFLVGLAGATARTRAGTDPVQAAMRDEGTPYVSARGLRDTVEAIDRMLARRGFALDKVGPYRVRGVELVRWLDDGSRGSPWRAIHVWRAEGKTWISFVKRTP